MVGVEPTFNLKSNLMKKENTFGDKIETLRKKHNLTQSELAARANLGRAKIMRMEKLNSADTVLSGDLDAIARVLSVRVDQLITSRVRQSDLDPKRIASIMRDPQFMDIQGDLSETELAKALEFFNSLYSKKSLSSDEREEMIGVFIAAIRGDLI